MVYIYICQYVTLYEPKGYRKRSILYKLFHGVTMIIARFNIACRLDYCNTSVLIVTMQPTSYPGE